MVLDYFYANKYREYMPQLRFVEIMDSYGPKKAAEFVEMKQDNTGMIISPIHTSMINIFSKIEGKVEDPIFSVMKEMGFEICKEIEDTEALLTILDEGVYYEYNNVNVLDIASCDSPEGMNQLPTKLYSKIRNIHPDVILTRDSRKKGSYRMVSTNTDSLRFLHNPHSYFVHNSGFLVGFDNYEDYKLILKSYQTKQ